MESAGINWSTVLFQIINFLVMVFILTRFFFRPVVRILDERSKKVTRALTEAEQREKEAAEIRAQYEKQLAETQEQVLAMRQRAQEELEGMRRRVLTETREEIAQVRDKAERELAEARQQAMSQHQRELGTLVITLSEQLMREVGGDSFQQASLEHFVQGLSALSLEEHRHLFVADEDEVVHVQLVSAREPDSDSVSRIAAHIQGIVGKPVEVKCKVDPALVGGARLRFGDIVIDGSVAGQLQGLGERYVKELGQSKA